MCVCVRLALYSPVTATRNKECSEEEKTDRHTMIIKQLRWFDKNNHCNTYTKIICGERNLRHLPYSARLK